MSQQYNEIRMTMTAWYGSPAKREILNPMGPIHRVGLSDGKNSKLKDSPLHLRIKGLNDLGSPYLHTYEFLAI